MAAPADAAADPADGVPVGPAARRLGWVGLGVAAFSFLVALLAASILGLAWAATQGLDQGEVSRDLGFALLSSVGLWLGFLVLPLLWSPLVGGPGRVLGLRAHWTDLPLGVAVGLVSTLVTSVVSSVVLSGAQEEALESKAQETVGRASGPTAVVLLVVALCVATPLAEEVFFRGLLFRSLHRVAGLALAAPLAGLVFGLVHYDPAPVAAVVVAVQLGLLSLFGIALCILVHRTGRLAASIVAHAVFNAMTVFNLLAQR